MGPHILLYPPSLYRGGTGPWMGVSTWLWPRQGLGKLLGEKAAAWLGQTAREDANLGWDFPGAKPIPLPGSFATGKQAASVAPPQSAPSSSSAAPGAVVSDPVSPRRESHLGFPEPLSGSEKASFQSRRHQERRLHTAGVFREPLTAVAQPGTQGCRALSTRTGLSLTAL